jgi:16S rRNA (uracil1498-N3)-methyltransferase
MPQILISPDDLTGNSFVIKGKEAHHLIRVLRKKTGDEIEIFDGRGGQFVGRLTAVDTKANEVRGLIFKKKIINSRPHSLILYQCLPRGSKFDFVIEKATELGVDYIVPLLSKKNPIQLSAEKMGAKVPRWRDSPKRRPSSATGPMFRRWNRPAI